MACLDPGLSNAGVFLLLSVSLLLRNIPFLALYFPGSKLQTPIGPIGDRSQTKTSKNEGGKNVNNNNGPWQVAFVQFERR
ncbi:hypothetical protein ASPZODRAFT_131914 [Penicilliopsis zonata CBS 506.65]|uniref:Uncharacterized protein n=1 Tax=Penicilliopsis zonata CBS 506.65 TaxID=1073090 RepID=A0A1L9SIQ2_9EURO|nr:hypothetical protein ASPZODRAFT_131914 [Penicilliopsis zonata CBS 506.65]OJJ46996.1 hypothetical protein ASPZODRAFT_131914 [Penicilliopsis zonata CBS 506.65]